MSTKNKRGSVVGFDGVDVALDSEKLLKKTTENNVFSKIYNTKVSDNAQNYKLTVTVYNSMDNANKSMC